MDRNSKYKIPLRRKILLGVASIWEKRKGLDFFIELSNCISEDYIIVLVGLNKWQMYTMPQNIIGIGRTENREELSVLYSAAHIFINPSMEESFSLVTVEAMACGTPVIALDTSAVKELIDVQSGIVLRENRVTDYLEAIKNIELSKLQEQRIAETALKYSKQRMTEEILQLYKEQV